MAKMPSTFEVSCPAHGTTHTVHVRTVRETVHACPPGSSGVMPCCGRTPFEVSRSDRMTVDPALVTCGV